MNDDNFRGKISTKSLLENSFYRILFFKVIICAILISDTNAQSNFRGHQSFNRQASGWQNRAYQGRQNFNNYYPTSRPVYYEQPSFTIRPPSIPPEVARQNVPLIVESPYKTQPNYGYKPQPLSTSAKATIVKQQYERRPDGGYRFL